MLEAGTTTCEVKTGYGLDFDSELRMLSAILELKHSCASFIDIVPTFMPAHAIPPGEDRAALYWSLDFRHATSGIVYGD
jgi:imidazolonepropionase